MSTVQGFQIIMRIFSILNANIESFDLIYVFSYLLHKIVHKKMLPPGALLYTLATVDSSHRKVDFSAFTTYIQYVKEFGLWSCVQIHFFSILIGKCSKTHRFGW